MAKILLRLLKNLKSSLDRFIVHHFTSITNNFAYLKSSLDRFIAAVWHTVLIALIHLKSSLDRFIGVDNAVKQIQNKI